MELMNNVCPKQAFTCSLMDSKRTIYDLRILVNMMIIIMNITTLTNI